MYNGILHLHNLLRWVILLLLLIALFRHMAGMMNRRAVTRGDQRVDLFLMITAHITFVVGIYQWIAGPWGLKLIRGQGMSDVMANDQYRFWAIEHITGMVIAIALITVGRAAIKRAVDWRAHKKAFWFFLIALLLVLVSIPWPFREGIGRPWFPGMS